MKVTYATLLQVVWNHPSFLKMSTDFNIGKYSLLIAQAECTCIYNIVTVIVHVTSTKQLPW